MRAVDLTEPAAGVSQDVPGTRPQTRSLSGEKAQRIIDAMRRCVAQRGTAGSTFDRVSREAGVSRGLLHYYFGTKEQLLLEAVRRDADVRLEVLERRLATAQTADDYIDLLAQDLQETLRDDPDFITLMFELFTLSRRNADIAIEYGRLMRRTREQLADMLELAQSAGILRLHAAPKAVADTLFALADGLALRMLSEPDRDFTESLQASIDCARSLLTD
jgi:AcrR family transcriptional regulator